MRFPRTSGLRTAARLSLLLPLALGGCLYGFRGGGGFPADIRTVNIQPFDNETTEFQLQGELFNQLLDRVPPSLGLKIAGEGIADAVLSGKIVRYDDAAENYRADQTSGIQDLQHKVQIVVSARIVDVKRNVILWENTNVTGQGTYQPTTESGQVGQQQALQDVVNKILDGAQSQW